MFAYNLEKFASLYAFAFGQRLWAFLTRPENVARLETASELSKPAVEGIEEQFLAEFRDDVLAHRVKQMVGTWCGRLWSSAIGCSTRPT